MVKLKHNSKNVDRSKDFHPPKPGAYLMKIESCTYEKDKERKVFAVRQTEADEEGHGKGYGYWDYVADHVEWKMDQWLNAIGIETEGVDEVSFDTQDFVGKIVRGRVVEDFYDGDYRPKLGRVFPVVAEEEDEEGWEEDSEVEAEAEDEAEADESPADLDDYTSEDLTGLGERADAEEADAVEEVSRLADLAGLDSNEYETWGEVAEAVAATLKPKAAPAKKAAAKKAAAPAKKAAAAQAEEAPEDDYETWEVADLRAEAEGRGLAKGGAKAALIARLRADDADPF